MPGLLTNRAQFSQHYLDTQLPVLDHFINDGYNYRPDQYPQFFNVSQMKGSISQAAEATGFGQFVSVTEGANTTYDAIRQGYTKNYVPLTYTLGFRVTHEMMADDKHGLVSGMATALGRSAKETMEATFASVYNNAFSGSYLGPDGKSLCASDHPLVGGGTQSNLASPAVDLDVSSLEAACIVFRKWVNDRGLKVRLIPRTLMVPPDLAYVATEILKSPMRSDTANNTINAFSNGAQESGMLTPKVYEYLTDTDAWFLLADTRDLRIRVKIRESFNTMHDTDFDSRAIKTAGWYRCVAGWDGEEGVYGSAGA